MSKSMFIVIEGIDGSGKSTQIDLLQKRFQAEGKKAMTTHEPTDGPIGKLIRSILSGDEEVDASVMAALYLADRLDHIKNPESGILAMMEKGFNVISSRYYYSSYAFQGEYVSLQWLISANSICKSFLKADITFYLNIDPVITLKRLTESREKLDIYENIEKQTNTHEDFMNAFETTNDGENIVILDGTLSIEDLHEEIWKKVKEMTF
ncbi:MAG: dTMP kinase [Saprospiraceae bacterium]|jgi:dTMP kinase|uniref:dTMP kinase n=1 Tax=Candidatus Brachybacter algidus TaxID=2982024 RepID=UPI001B4A0C93|nr:dTMP kinase [Candidatus Brachybacter algidus]MBP7307151.1 dTMP kinase [Saprospiraceae bacterium]MBK6450450.1 dTMP kinase [Candidatus Brachybacter algidus]MBK7605225.1 dTMP kinase [Candidatus Brachybacter algidus]MBK8356119.1 dTMP kinase [Candidatus Brachybacter algidus]MBK8603452.1 dTMP kinase [Candidatus Brachybacter algidus]